MRYCCRERLDALPKGAKDLSFGNSVYTIRFESRTERPLFGHRYWFFLKDAVDDVPEYIVHWENFVKCVIHPLPGYSALMVLAYNSMAAEYGLHVLYKEEFHQVFEEHSEHPEFAPLLERMHVVDKNGESQMDEDQWEAASEYTLGYGGVRDADLFCRYLCRICLREAVTDGGTYHAPDVTLLGVATNSDCPRSTVIFGLSSRATGSGAQIGRKRYYSITHGVCALQFASRSCLSM